MNHELPPVPPTPVPSSSLPPVDELNRRNWNMWCHLSALSGFLVPLGNFIGPLVVWQMKKHELPGIEAHGRAALNFQISMFIYGLAGAAVTLVSAFFCLAFLMIPLLFILVAVIGVGSLVCTIIAALRANEGKDYAYPLSLKLL
jgi:uncharacterized protein